MDVRQLGAMGLIIVVASIIISMGVSIFGELIGQHTDNSIEEIISDKGLSGLVTFGNWIPLIALVIVAAIVIGVIVNYLGRVGGSV